MPLNKEINQTSRRKKVLNSNQLYSRKKLTISHIVLVAEGLGKYIHMRLCIQPQSHKYV